MDSVFDLFIVMILIAAVLTAIVLPIVVLAISLISRKRVSRIEARLDQIEATLAGRSPSEPVPNTEPLPPVTTPAPSFSAAQLESIIGRRWVGWAAIALILFATAFFLKYAFDNRWIGELGRVGIGITSALQWASPATGINNEAGASSRKS